MRNEGWLVEILWFKKYCFGDNCLFNYQKIRFFRPLSILLSYFYNIVKHQSINQAHIVTSALNYSTGSCTENIFPIKVHITQLRLARPSEHQQMSSGIIRDSKVPSLNVSFNQNLKKLISVNYYLFHGRYFIYSIKLFISWCIDQVIKIEIICADHRSEKAQTKIVTTSSAAQLSICFSHQPDLVTNSIRSEQTATKLQQLELQSSKLEKQISSMRCSLRHRTLGFEAMLMLVKRLSEEVRIITYFICWTLFIMARFINVFVIIIIIILFVLMYRWTPCKQTSITYFV